MADIRAFRAYRYDLGRVGALGDVVAPPYDVIDPELQQALYAKSPYNVVRLILNQEQPGDDESENRYTRAARCLRAWRQEGILSQDSARALYVYHQEFELEGRRYTRRGFMARVRLERFGEGKIFPHEETMAGPKEDRLKLMRATGMNLSQVFGLYPDVEGAVQARLDAAVGRSLPLEAMDHLGVVNRLWAVTDQHLVSEVTGLMGPKPIFIADGHHRYETALRYLDECRAEQTSERVKVWESAGADAAARSHAHTRSLSHRPTDLEAAPNFALLMLVSMSDPGLVILPTHRLVGGIQELNAAQLRALLANHFQVETVGRGETGARDAWELIQAYGGQEMLGLGTAADGVWQTARLREPALMAALAPERSPAWRELGVSILHVLVLGHLLAEKLGPPPAGPGFDGGTSSRAQLPSLAQAPQGKAGASRCRYVHLLREVIEAVGAKDCQLAVLVPPATMRQVERIAGNWEKMPPKSTYFYPKLLSGLVFNPLV